MKTKSVLRLRLALLVVFIFFISSAGVADDGLTPKESLGKALFFNKISSPDWMSCSTCHDPDMGFTGPLGGINKHGAAYRGADPHRFGNRKPPSAAYATLSPVLHYDEGDGTFVGGNFWDGRATGESLGNPAAEQALGPFLNPVEQNNPAKQAVLEQIADSKYADLWEEAWGEPISYETEADINKNYDRVGLSIAAYEGSSEVNQFSSKYDLFLAGEVELTDQEAWGLELFEREDKGNCAACHPSEQGDGGEPPLFTDFTFDNLGVPRNPDNPFYDMDEIFLDDGSPINPLGSAWIDKGLGGFLETRPEYSAMAAENMGKQKVPTLRNVDKRPGNNTPKAYMHNGVFKSLEEVVHFYNTRDVEEWPAPEVEDNVNHEELGNLGLTKEEEAAIVAFLRTLSDGYIPGKEKDKDKNVEALDKDKDEKEVEQPEPDDFVIEWDQPQITAEQIDKGFDERSAAEEDFAFALFEADSIIDQLSPEDFKNKESALEMKIEFDAVFGLLEQDMYAEALMLLEIDILNHVDGCYYDGQPDSNDWITSYQGQYLVYPILVEATELLANLVQ